jgi:hypothetical protein
MSRPTPVPLDRVRALLAWWQRRQPLEDPRFEVMMAALLARLDTDRARYSDIFEPSFSWEEGAPCHRRFSFAFPGFRAAPDEVERALAALAAPWGEPVADACARVMRAARHGAVVQPLFGFADDRGRGLRLKLYVQFRDGATPQAAALARALTGAAIAPERLNGSLHMLGLDFTVEGLSGAKLYVVPRDRAETSALLDIPLSKVLMVHRIAQPQDDFSTGAPELDFSLADNQLDAATLLQSSQLKLHYREALDAFAELSAAIGVRIRRVSLSTGPRRKLTFYYVPTAE